MVSHAAETLDSEKGKALRGEDGKGKYGPLVMAALGGMEVRATPCETKPVSSKMRKTSGRWSVFGSGGER